MMRENGLGPPLVSCSQRILTTPVDLERTTMFYRVRSEFMHGQADVLGCLWIQYQFGPFNESRTVTQIMEGGEL